MTKNILVIEDDVDVRENIIELLTEEGYNTFSADGGLKGLELIKKEDPDLIICDISMPDMDGLEILKVLNSENNNPQRPFLFLSAKTSKIDVRTGMNLGADDYLTKPYTHKEILDAISTRFRKVENQTERVNKLRKSIILALPHELRTPLSVIYMASELLKGKQSSLETEEVFEFGDMIHASAEKIQKVYSKYINMTEIYMERSDENKLKELKTDVCDYPDNILKVVAKDTAYNYNRPDDLVLKLKRASINIDEDLLKRLLHEIIDNAFKFSRNNSEVKIRGGISFTEYLISITNTGSTMNNQEISQIGEFMQFGRKENEFSGLGLGLAVAKGICENYNASFKITSTANSVTVSCRFRIVRKNGV